MSDIRTAVREAKRASLELAAVGTAEKDMALAAMAEALDAGREAILAANADDMAAAEAEGLEGPMLKRLSVTDEKIDGMIAGIRDVAALKDPVGQTMSAKELDEGLVLYQVSCPIGMIGVIFESRPDVVPQIMSLCLKSGNGVVFKGGREAVCTNRALFGILRDAAMGHVPADAFVMAETRDDVDALLDLDDCIDLLIPRGSNAFVRHIKESTRIPVLGHAAGICHVYVDSHADPVKAERVVFDSKVQYPAVCNAMETLLVHRDAAGSFLPVIAARFAEAGVEMRCDPESMPLMPGSVPASEDDWDTEYGDLTVSVHVVGSVGEAAAFINEHGSHHTDAIVTEDRSAAASFVSSVDSADVFVNASTRFADGYRFGKGAEVGISTNKIHSRGPVGMEGLMIYKYVLIGEGNIVADYAGKGARRFTHRDLDRELDL